ncbi:ABC transporter permease [Bacillus sp. 1P06AnD]|uniref:ABC transporter permease n=1 Tax=Bacillus sp. 1P06AnD TaxID=3132208 RepID=UPI0039A0867D
MNFTKRAILYVTRKKGKTILLFAILLIMATFVLTGLSIWRASEVAQLGLRQSLGASFNVGVDWSDDNPYMVKQRLDEKQTGNDEKQSINYLMYSRRQFTPEIVNEIRKIDGIKYCDASTEGLATFKGLSLFAGTIPIDETYRKQTKVQGVWKLQENELFTSGALSLVEGEYITANDAKKAVISQDLAEKSGLKIGDMLTTHSVSGKKVEVQIVGFFAAAKIEGITDMVTGYDKIQNRVFVDLDTAIHIEDSPAVQGFSVIKITVNDPQNMEEVVSNVKELSSIDWKAFTVDVNNEAYEKAAQPLMALSELIITLLVVIIVVSAIILALILTLWTKTRIHEIGVFLSVGIKKSAIFGQYLLEVLMIAVIAFGISFFTSNAIADQIGDRLLSQSVHDESMSQSQEGETTGAMGNSVSIGRDENLANPATDIGIHVSVGLDNLGLLYLIGCFIIIIAVGVSSITVMRLKPREILSKMS